MEIIYNLTDREKDFLRALKNKTYPQNAWSGRSSDDKFIKEWGKEIETFTKAGLTKKRDDGHYDSYWCYGLNAKGLLVQEKYAKD